MKIKVLVVFLFYIFVVLIGGFLTNFLFRFVRDEFHELIVSIFVLDLCFGIIAMFLRYSKTIHSLANPDHNQGGIS